MPDRNGFVICWFSCELESAITTDLKSYELCVVAAGEFAINGYNTNLNVTVCVRSEVAL